MHPASCWCRHFRAPKQALRSTTRGMRTDTSTRSSASTKRNSQQPTSAVDAGMKPAGAAAAGSASVPPPMVEPAMSTMVATVALQKSCTPRGRTDAVSSAAVWEAQGMVGSGWRGGPPDPRLPRAPNPKPSPSPSQSHWREQHPPIADAARTAACVRYPFPCSAHSAGIRAKKGKRSHIPRRFAFFSVPARRAVMGQLRTVSLLGAWAPMRRAHPPALVCVPCAGAAPSRPSGRRRP